MFSNCKLLTLSTLLFVSFSEPSIAQRTTSDTYECVIKDRKELTDEGLLTSERLNDVVGKIFFVDRFSGLATGEFRNYINPTDVELINGGSSELSFVALSYVGPFKYVLYLEIEEWNSGLEKPFFAMDNIRGMLTGLCKGR